MAISYIGATTGNSNNGGSFNLTISGIGGIQTNDLVVIASNAFGRAGNEGLIGASYSQIVDQTNTQRLRVGWKYYSSSDGTVAITGSGQSTDAMTAIALVLRGIDASSPIDATATPATGSASAPNPPNVTFGGTDDCILAFGALNANSAPSALTNYSPATPVGANRTDNNPCGIGGGYRILSGAPGSEDPAAFTWANGTWVAATIAIKAKIVYDLTANDLRPATAVSFGAPTLGQVHVLNANGLRPAGSVLFGAPTLSQIYNLTANNLISGSPLFGAPALTTRGPFLFLSDDVLDSGLAMLQQHTDHIVVCRSLPLSYETLTQVALGNMGFSANAFTAPQSGADAVYVTSTVISNGQTTAEGVPYAWAAIDEASSKLLAAGPLTGGTQMSIGQPWQLSAFTINMPRAE